MPLYDYECVACGHVFELRQSFDADPEGVCPRCSGSSRRKFHAVPIIYKGSGFYTTDYKHTSYSPNSKDGAKDEESKEKTKTAKATTDSSEEKGSSKAAPDGSKDKQASAKGA